MLCFPLRCVQRSSQVPPWLSITMAGRTRPGGRDRRSQWGPHPLHRSNQHERFNRDHPCGFVHRPRKYPYSWHRHIPSRFQRAVWQHPIHQRLVPPHPARHADRWLAASAQLHRRGSRRFSLRAFYNVLQQRRCPYQHVLYGLRLAVRHAPQASVPTAAVTKQSGAPTWRPSGDASWVPTTWNGSIGHW